jgi:NAD(P)-dependent dehydrogenase (short-subunit alcohol dehydrogenase family)
MTRSLTGKLALVTGAAKGIGAGLAASVSRERIAVPQSAAGGTLRCARRKARSDV